MPSFIRGRKKKFEPSALRHGGPEGRVYEFNALRPLQHANVALDTGESLAAGPQEPSVFGFKAGNAGAGNVKWFFFRHEENARQFQRDLLLARLSN